MPAPRHVTASGTHYAREGEGPALVFIHGAGGNAAAWFQQVEAFARDYCVLCIDLPGFGQTLPRQLANTTESLAHVVLEVLDHAGFESASLIGQSLGGWFALRAALAAPERIERLTLSCTMAGIAHPPAFAAFTAAMAKMGSSGVGALTLTPEFRASQGNRAYLFNQITAFNPPLDMAAVSALFSSDVLLSEAEIASVQCPVLMISGRDDPIWPPASLAGIASLFPDGSQKIVKDSGHSPYFEKPAQFNTLLAEFQSE